MLLPESEASVKKELVRKKNLRTSDVILFYSIFLSVLQNENFSWILEDLPGFDDPKDFEVHAVDAGRDHGVIFEIKHKDPETFESAYNRLEQLLCKVCRLVTNFLVWKIWGFRNSGFLRLSKMALTYVNMHLITYPFFGLSA